MNVLRSCVFYVRLSVRFILLRDTFLLDVSFGFGLYIIVIYSARDLYVFGVGVFLSE